MRKRGIGRDMLVRYEWVKIWQGRVEHERGEYIPDEYRWMWRKNVSWGSFRHRPPLLPRFFISLYTSHISPCSPYLLYLLTIPRKHTPSPVMPFMYISCVPHYYYISGILFHISFSSVFLSVSPVFCQRKNFLFRFSSRIYPARNFWKTTLHFFTNHRINSWQNHRHVVK